MREVPAPLVAGVDGGASKTVALVAACDGTVLGAGRAGNADIYQVPDAVGQVREALAAALAQAGATPRDLAAVALSLVGADWPEDMDHWRAAAGDLAIGHIGSDRLIIVNDAIGALTAGAPDGPAVAIVVGTGCAVGARGPSGRLWHSSFWQRTQGGAEMASLALDAVYSAHIGIASPTDLTPRALAHFGADDVPELLHAFTARAAPATRPVASFAPHVLDAAGSGDAVARALVLDHAEAVARYGQAALAQVGIDGEASLVLGGGVLRHPSRLMADVLVARMRDALPRLTVVERPPEPALGVVLLALGASGGARQRPGAVSPSARVLDRLMATQPAPGFFHTGLVQDEGACSKD